MSDEQLQLAENLEPSFNKNFETFKLQTKDTKGVYRNFRGTKINVENLRSKDEVESFWKSIWCRNVTFNKDAPWINGLVVNYCKGAKQNLYSVDLKTHQ